MNAPAHASLRLACEIILIGERLSRRWTSHGEVDGRGNREYRFDGSRCTTAKTEFGRADEGHGLTEQLYGHLGPDDAPTEALQSHCS
jgi:hypothetical protein